MLDNQSSTPLWTTIATLLNSEFVRLITSELVRLWREYRFQGTYKVAAYHATLELMDDKVAIYTKQQRVTFLQNNVFAIQDQAWGNGDIFKNYMCSPGHVVDKYQEGYRWNVLISLRRTYKRGDEENIVIQRTIENGFTTDNETFQVQIDHPMQQLILDIIFPSSRLPQKIFVVENNMKRSHLLDEAQQTQFPDGRLGYTWRFQKPHLFEGYIIKWNW